MSDITDYRLQIHPHFNFYSLSLLRVSMSLHKYTFSFLLLSMQSNKRREKFSFPSFHFLSNQTTKNSSPSLLFSIRYPFFPPTKQSVRFLENNHITAANAHLYSWYPSSSGCSYHTYSFVATPPLQN